MSREATASSSGSGRGDVTLSTKLRKQLPFTRAGDMGNFVKVPATKRALDQLVSTLNRD